MNQNDSFWNIMRQDFVKEYIVFVDKKPAPDVSTNVLEALEVLISTYFVFNRLYPKKAVCFLLFLQVKFLRILEDNSKAGNKVSRNKVISFVKHFKGVSEIQI